MNSLTHSCIHSLASLAILAFSGRAVFIIRATGAAFLILVSRKSCLGREMGSSCLRGGETDEEEEEEEESWDMIGCVSVVTQPTEAFAPRAQLLANV
jgi:hypothetical protein